MHRSSKLLPEDADGYKGYREKLKGRRGTWGQSWMLRLPYLHVCCTALRCITSGRLKKERLTNARMKDQREEGGMVGDGLAGQIMVGAMIHMAQVLSNVGTLQRSDRRLSVVVLGAKAQLI